MQTHRVIARKGGIARMQMLTPEARKALAKYAINIRWTKWREANGYKDKLQKQLTPQKKKVYMKEHDKKPELSNWRKSIADQKHKNVS